MKIFPRIWFTYWHSFWEPATLALAQLISENTLCPPFFCCIPLEVELDALLLSKPRESVVVANTTDISFVYKAFYLLVTFSLHVILKLKLEEAQTHWNVTAPPLKHWFAEESNEGSLRNFGHPPKGWGGNQIYQKVNRKLRQTSVRLQDMWIHSRLQLFQLKRLCCLST